MRKSLLRIATLLTGAGFCIAASLQVAAAFDAHVQQRPITFVLAVGLFLVCLPAVALQSRSPNGRLDPWQVFVIGSPQWMRVAAVFLLINAGLMFAMGVLVLPPRGSGRPSDPRFSLMLFGAWMMLFYGFSYATLRAGRRVKRCSQGHCFDAEMEACPSCDEPGETPD